MADQILNTRASEKFLVKSLSEAKVSILVVKFEIFMKNHDFRENSVESKFSQEIDFLTFQNP